MKDNDLINTLIVMAGVESKQSGAMPMEDNPMYLAAILIKDLKERIAKQTSALRRMRSIFRDDNYDTVSSAEALRKLAFVIDQTGEQHLNEFLAHAGREGFIAGIRRCDNFIDSYYAGLVTDADADEYANQIRNGGSK